MYLYLYLMIGKESVIADGDMARVVIADVPLIVLGLIEIENPIGPQLKMDILLESIVIGGIVLESTRLRENDTSPGTLREI